MASPGRRSRSGSGQVSYRLRVMRKIASSLGGKILYQRRIVVRYVGRSQHGRHPDRRTGDWDVLSTPNSRQSRASRADHPVGKTSSEASDVEIWDPHLTVQPDLGAGWSGGELPFRTASIAAHGMATAELLIPRALVEIDRGGWWCCASTKTVTRTNKSWYWTTLPLASDGVGLSVSRSSIYQA